MLAFPVCTVVLDLRKVETQQITFQIQVSRYETGKQFSTHSTVQQKALSYAERSTKFNVKVESQVIEMPFLLTVAGFRIVWTRRLRTMQDVFLNTTNNSGRCIFSLSITSILYIWAFVYNGLDNGVVATRWCCPPAIVF